MILNLCIPVYNNYNGVINTITSLNAYNFTHKIIIHIINDCSTDQKDYNQIQTLFNSFYEIKVYKTPCNGGPGKARQFALDLINKDYIMFIDAGDIIYSPVEFNDYLNLVEENPKTLLFSPSHYEQNANNSYSICGMDNNRMHGKIYKTSFLKKYNIHFSSDFCSMNEDIGFNMLCRICCEYLQSIDPNTLYYINYDNPIVIWTFEPDSLTRKDNYAFYFKQNLGLGYHITNIVQQALSNGIPYESFIYRVHEVFVYLYVYYICALNERPEYMEDAFQGAFYFYKNILISYSINQDILLQAYNETMRIIYNGNYHSFCSKLPTVSILDFLIMLDKSYLQSQENNENDN